MGSAQGKRGDAFSSGFLRYRAWLQQTNSTHAEKYELSPADYASHGGSFPLNVTGARVVGCVTVSGLP